MADVPPESDDPSATRDHPAPRRRTLARAGTLLAFFAGAALGFVFLQSPFATITVPIAAGALTAVYAARELARPAPPSRWRSLRRALGMLAWGVLGLAYALFAYLAFAWGSLLYWSVLPWGWAVVAAGIAAAALTARRSWEGPRVPLVVPLGAWIALCLLGWRVEETRARCDDYLATRSDPALSVIEPTTRRLEACEPGDVMSTGRFPRVIWESPSRDRMIVTSQLPLGATAEDGERFTGSVCEVRDGHEPVCAGEGTVQGLAEAVALDRLFLANWGRWPGDIRGQLLSIPRSGPLETLRAVPTHPSLGELFYDPRADRVYGFTDEGFEALPFVASTLTAEPAIALPIFPPHRAIYDQERGEGILCATGGPFAQMNGERYMALAIRGDPLSFRPLGTGALALVTLSWGCNWDPAARTAYVAIPNLGLLATIDYDSGEILRTRFVGFGMRSITVDAPRGRLYLTNFLGGYVAAIDAASGDEVERWEVGRFPRFTTLSRDGAALLVGTTLGVVSVRLGPVE